MPTFTWHIQYVINIVSTIQYLQNENYFYSTLKIEEIKYLAKEKENKRNVYKSNKECRY